MSFTATRAELAAVLSTVAGVKGYEFRPKVIKAGAAWPLLETATRGPGDAFDVTWRVIVALGGDEKAAQTKLDDLMPLLVDAIDPVAFVDSARPVTVQTSAGDLFAIEITARSE